MEKYEFTTLAWLALSDGDAAKASKWYEGSGWYVNPVDETGQLKTPRLVLEAATAPNGQLEALRLCGQDGWFVAAFVAAPKEGLWEELVSAIAGLQHAGPHFILQRRTGG